MKGGRRSWAVPLVCALISAVLNYGGFHALAWWWRANPQPVPEKVTYLDLVGEDEPPEPETEPEPEPEKPRPIRLPKPRPKPDIELEELPEPEPEKPPEK